MGGGAKSIGVMLLKNTHLRGFRAMAEAASYRWPARFVTVAAEGLEVVLDHKRRLADPYRAAASQLAGTAMITSNCGFALRYQDAVRRATRLPTALSAMLLYDLLRAIYGEQVTVITYDCESLRETWRQIRGEELGSLIGLSDLIEWQKLAAADAVELDKPAMFGSLISRVRDAIATAFLVECTGVLPFVPQLRTLGRPVFDIYSVIDLLISAEGGLN